MLAINAPPTKSHNRSRQQSACRQTHEVQRRRCVKLVQRHITCCTAGLYSTRLNNKQQTTANTNRQPQGNKGTPDNKLQHVPTTLVMQTRHMPHLPLLRHHLPLCARAAATKAPSLPFPPEQSHLFGARAARTKPTPAKLEVDTCTATATKPCASAPTAAARFAHQHTAKARKQSAYTS